MNGTQKYCSYCGSTQERYYSAETVAEILDCSPETIRGWINDRKIDSFKIRGLRRISEADLKKVISRRQSIEQLTVDAMID